MNPYTEPKSSLTCKHCSSEIRWVEGHGWAKPKDSFAEMGLCAKRAQGHQLRDVHDYEHASANIWKALVTFDPNRAERKELAASGVAEHTIDALLGSSTELLVSGLIELLHPGSLDFMAKYKRFADTSAFGNELTEAQREQYRADWKAWGGSEVQWELVAHISDILPRGVKANLARQCSSYFWEACWYMAHAGELASFEKRSRWVVELIELLLPDLFKRVNALRRVRLATA